MKAQAKLHRLAELMPEIERAVAFRGHAEGRWTNQGGFLRLWTCADCGMEAQANPSPAPNEIDIGGEAVALDCTPDE